MPDHRSGQKSGKAKPGNLGRHPDLRKLLPMLGRVKEPTTKEDRIVEAIDSEFMFEGFPGFEEGLSRVREILQTHSISVSGAVGQSIIKEYVEHCLDEMYGDFCRWADCGRCSQHFQPEISLEYANAVLGENVLCARCSMLPEETRETGKRGARPRSEPPRSGAETKLVRKGSPPGHP